MPVVNASRLAPDERKCGGNPASFVKLRTKRRLCSIISLLFALLAAACTGEPTPVPQVRGLPPTLPAPAYRESAGPIDAASAAQVALLGRLDQPEMPSTLFAYALSPDGTRLAALNNDELLAWDLLTGALAFHTARLDAVSLCYSPDKTEIFAIRASGQVTAYAADSGAERASLQVHDRYNNVSACDARGGRAAFGGSDGSIRIWDLIARQPLAATGASRGETTALAFSPDGDLLASAGLDGQARLWEAGTGVQRAALPLEDLLVYRLAFAPDGGQIALGSEGDLRLWSTAAPSSAHRLAAPPGGAAQILLYAPDGRALIGGSSAGGLQIWDPAALAGVGLIDVTGLRISADFAPQGELLLTSALGAGAAIYDLSGAGGSGLARGQIAMPGAAIYAVEWTDDGRLLLLFDASGPVYVWGLGAE